MAKNKKEEQITEDRIPPTAEEILTFMYMGLDETLSKIIIEKQKIKDDFLTIKHMESNVIEQMKDLENLIKDSKNYLDYISKKAVSTLDNQKLAEEFMADD